MKGARDLAISFIFIGIFVFALMQGAFYFAVSNNANISLVDDPVIKEAFVDMNSTLINTEDNIQSNMRDPVEKEDPGGQDFLSWKSIKFALQSLFTVPIGVYNVMTGMLKTRMGIPALIVNLFGAILLITGVIFLWKAWKTGS